MERRGQIYLLTAIILAFIIFGLVSVVNKAGQESLKSDFEKLSANYEAESAKLVNYLLLKERTPDEIKESFQNFTIQFTSYAKTKNPKFGLVYAFNFKNKLYIGNYLDKEINKIECYDSKGRKTCSDKELSACYEKIPSTIELGGLALDVDFDQSLIKDCHSEIVPTGEIKYLKLTITADKPYSYIFELLPNQPQIMLMSQEEKGEQRKVYVPKEARKNSRDISSLAENSESKDQQDQQGSEGGLQ